MSLKLVSSVGIYSAVVIFTSNYGRFKSEFGGIY